MAYNSSCGTILSKRLFQFKINNGMPHGLARHFQKTKLTFQPGTLSAPVLRIQRNVQFGRLLSYCDTSPNHHYYYYLAHPIPYASLAFFAIQAYLHKTINRKSSGSSYYTGLVSLATLVGLTGGRLLEVTASELLLVFFPLSVWIGTCFSVITKPPWREPGRCLELGDNQGYHCSEKT